MFFLAQRRSVADWNAGARRDSIGRGLHMRPCRRSSLSKDEGRRFAADGRVCWLLKCVMYNTLLPGVRRMMGVEVVCVTLRREGARMADGDDAGRRFCRRKKAPATGQVVAKV